MGKKSSSPQVMFLPQQQQTSSTTTNQLPQWVQDAGKANYDAAANMNPAAFSAYYGQRVADLNGGQLNAINALNQNVGATNEAFQNASNQSNAATNSAMQQMGLASNTISDALNPASVRDAIAGLNSQIGQRYSDIQYGGNPAQGGIDTMNNALSGANSSVNTSQGMIGQAYNPVYQATNPAMNALQGSIQNAQQLQGYTPQQISAQSVPQGDLSGYMNPYTQNVINSSLNVLDQQRKGALNQNADAAIRSKAFGGSRQAIQDAATDTQYGLQGAQLAANLNNQNYQQALSAMQADQARNLQAQQANQSAGLQGAQLAQSANQLGQSAANQLGSLGLNTGAFNINAANALGNLGLNNAQLGASVGNNVGQLGLSNQGQQIQAQQANMNAALQNQANNINAFQNVGGLGLNNAQLGVAAGNNMANIANNQGALGQSNASLMGNLANTQQANYLNSLNASLAGSGMLQAQNQNELDAQRQLFAEQQNSMLAPLNLRMQALGMTPYNTSSSSTGSSSGFTSQAYQPTSSSPLSTALGLGLGAASLMGSGGLSTIGSLGRMAMGGSILPSSWSYSSEKNDKTNIHKLGKDPSSGLPMYAYDYKSDVAAARKSGSPMPPKRVGPMAQDIEKLNPSAVNKIGGSRVVRGLI